MNQSNVLKGRIEIEERFEKKNDQTICSRLKNEHNSGKKEEKRTKPPVKRLNWSADEEERNRNLL